METTIAQQDLAVDHRNGDCDCNAAAAISAIDRAVDYYVDWLQASSHPAKR